MTLEYYNDRPLTLIPYPNGGWALEQPHRETMTYPTKIGAFSNAEDMIAFLRNMLVHNGADDPLAELDKGETNGQG